MSSADPIHAAIRRARAAKEVYTAACRAFRDDQGEETDRVCNAAAAAASQAIDAVGEVRPTTPAGLIALVEFYVEDSHITEMGTSHLKRLATILKACPIRFVAAGETV